MDLEVARTNMLKQQLRTSGIVDEALLMLFDNVPRERFVPADYYSVAYADAFIPIGYGQVMLSPVIEAKILQETAIQPDDKVLEIGTGTGYFTALLAKQAHHVTSVDLFPDFIETAATKLAESAVHNISLHEGNAATGWGKHLFDVIIVSGALQFLSESLLLQLAPGGRLFAIIGKAPVMQACLLTRDAEQGIITRILFETAVPSLLAAPQREVFNF